MAPEPVLEQPPAVVAWLLPDVTLQVKHVSNPSSAATQVLVLPEAAPLLQEMAQVEATRSVKANAIGKSFILDESNNANSVTKILNRMLHSPASCVATPLRC